MHLVKYSISSRCLFSNWFYHLAANDLMSSEFCVASKRNLGKKSIFMRLSTTNIGQLLLNLEFRLIHFQLNVEDEITFPGRRAICFVNDIDGGRHNFFHRANPKALEIRKTFISEI